MRLFRSAPALILEGEAALSALKTRDPPRAKRFLTSDRVALASRKTSSHGCDQQTFR